MNTHILVVEDETQIARVLKMELEYEGYQVTVEHDGKTGLEMALQSDIDLISVRGIGFTIREKTNEDYNKN